MDPGGAFQSRFEELARSSPLAPAVRDEGGAWTYAELWACSGRAAILLAQHGPRAACAPGTGPRPLALAVPRGREWCAICLGAWRLGLPVVALSDDLPKGRVAERERAARVAGELEPVALVTDKLADEALPGRPADCAVVDFAEVARAMTAGAGCSALEPQGRPVGATDVLCYVYTGGTTKHSKCVVVTHAMAMWEMRHYNAALRGRAGPGDRMLQYSSAFWGAAVFGQLDLALAFGACVVIVKASTPEEIAAACARHSISVLGVVPPQLRGAWPGGPSTRPSSLRTVVAWADRFPLELARQWAEHVSVHELLIASEYWLALHSDCSTCRSRLDGIERHVLWPLPNLDFQLRKEDGSPAGVGEVGELLLAGPTVSPGYLGHARRIGVGAESDAAFQQVSGRRYLSTSDRLERTPGGGLLYHGRAGSLVKRGGAWVDLEAIEQAATAVPGVASAAVVAAAGRMDAFLTLDRVPPKAFSHVLGQAKIALGPGCILHVWSELPVHPATGKVNRRTLSAHIEGSRSRAAARELLLGRVQRQMFAGYVAWHWFTLSIVVARCLLTASQLSVLSFVTDVLQRLLLLPCLWAALLYGMDSHGAKWGFPAWPLGAPDLVLVAAVATPGSLISCCAAGTCAYVAWARSRRRLAAAYFAAVCVAATRVETAISDEQQHGILGALVLSALLLLLLAPELLRFLLGLPISYFFSFPKWVRDDWSTRADCSWACIRRLVLAVAPCLQKPEFTASLAWDATLAAVDWGDEEYWMNVVMSSSNQDKVSHISFWDDVRPVVPWSSDGSAPTAQQAEEGLGRDAVALARLAERIGAHPPSLASMDSLQAISLVELTRRELGKAITVSDVLRSGDVQQLAERLQEPAQDGPDASARVAARRTGNPLADAEGGYRVYMMAFPKSPVDWYIKWGGPGVVDMALLQRAADRLVARHSVLRTVQSPDEAMREAMDRAAAVWQLCASCCGPLRGGRFWEAIASVVGASLFVCWPRTVTRSPQRASIAVHEIVVADAGESGWSADELMFWKAGQVRNRSFRYPFELFVVVVPQRCGEGDSGALTPSERASASSYLYAGITHAYSDGACGQALFRDLLQLYAEEAGVPQAATTAPPPAEPLAVLQRRLRRSLRGRLRGDAPDPGADVYHELACEDWGRREGFQRRIIMQENVLRALRAAAVDVIGCSIDVAWLTAIMGAMFRLFPDEPCFHLVLKCSCRDGPGEAEMVGFLSEQRVFPIDVGSTRHATLLDVANTIDTARRSRDWRAPVPYEAGLCVYVNIVSSMLDAVPLGCRQLTSSAPLPRSFSTDAYSHVNFRLDQKTEVDWDFRVFHFDASWGWQWGSYFAWSLGSVIGDMAECPTAALVPQPRMPRQCGGQTAEASPDAEAGVASPSQGTKRKETELSSGNSGAAPQGAVACNVANGRDGGRHPEGGGRVHHPVKVPRVTPQGSATPRGASP